MLTMSGLCALSARSVASQIVSDATAEPPGLSMRNTMARTFGSLVGLAEGARQRIGADAEAAAGSERAGIGLARLDQPVRVDHGDGRAAAMQSALAASDSRRAPIRLPVPPALILAAAMVSSRSPR